MGSGTVRINLVWAMLEHCLPGYSKRETKHHWRITFGDRTYRGFPLGPHGRRANPEIQLGHVRSLMRFFNEVFECPCATTGCTCTPLDCAMGQLEQLH